MILNPNAKSAKLGCRHLAMLPQAKQRGDSVARDALPVITENNFIVGKADFDARCAGIEGIVYRFAN